MGINLSNTSILTSSGGIDTSEQGPIDDVGITGSVGGGEGGGGAGGGVIIINPGSGGPSGYSYSVNTTLGLIGNAYVAFGTSKINCHSCVAVLNRHRAFSAAQNSSMTAVNCVSYACNRAFDSLASSFAYLTNCVGAISNLTYYMSDSSAIYAANCASIFPVSYGVAVDNNSNWKSTLYETATSIWSDNPNVPTPVHFISENGSYCKNPCTTLTTVIESGLSGPVRINQPISFVWSQIDPTLSINQNGLSIESPSNLASYHWVPIPHATDYSNVVGGDVVTQTTTLSPTGLLAIIGNERTNYASVKPPAGIFPPEDGSGKVGPGGITGNFSVSSLIPTI